ncbi:MAG: DUF1569 domain-containing protein [Bacteroidetes bacterium]|nr:DUF1569 domain-containing protein [Bacteroidota bacterium]
MSNTISEEAKQQFVARLGKLTPDSKAAWGSMNVTQMLTHMNDAFRICLGMKPAIDKSNFLWNKIIFPAAVYVLPGFPKGAATATELNQNKEGSKPRDFYTELEFLKKMLDVFNEREAEKVKPHPMFGTLSKEQWRDLLVKHLNHHLKQFGV